MTKTNIPPAKSTEWETPRKLFHMLDETFKFTLDCCATDENAKCQAYFTKDNDGLMQDWEKEVLWMNPPYGKGIEEWVKKAAEHGENGGIAVCLLPAYVSTGWWIRQVMGKANHIAFIKGRVHFVGAKHSATFPSAIVQYGWIGHGPRLLDMLEYRETICKMDGMFCERSIGIFDRNARVAHQKGTKQ